MEFKIDFYQNIFSKMDIGYAAFQVIRDDSGNLIDALCIESNPFFEKITGLTNKETVGKRASEIVPGFVKNDRARFGAIDQVLKTDVSIKTMVYWPTLSRWIDVTIIATGSDVFCIMFRDSTELVEKARKLEESESLYKHLLDSIPDGVLLCDIHGKILFSNRKAAELQGYNEPQEMMERILFEQGINDDISNGVKAKQELMETGKAQGFQMRLRRKDGGYTPVEINATLVPPSSGREPMILGLARDITSRLQLEKMESEKLERLNYDLNVNSALSALYVPLIKPMTTIREIAVSVIEQAKMLTQSEFALIACLNKSTGKIEVVHLLTDPDKVNTEAFNQSVSEMLENGQHLTPSPIWQFCLREKKEFYINNPDEHKDRIGFPSQYIKLRNFLVSPVYSGDECVGMIGLANTPNGYIERDLQTVRQMSLYYSLALQRFWYEQELGERQKKYESIAKEYQQFAYIASHDLREPLRTINCCLQLAMGDIGEEMQRKPDLKENLDFVLGSAKRLDMLIQNLLSYARLETKEIQMIDVDLNAVTAEALQGLRTSVSETHADISVDRLPVVKADKSQMLQVFQNLISNAIRYHQPNQNPKLHIGFEETEAEHIISFSDNGIGIDPSNFEKLFRMFQRIETGEQHSGTGIGLALCRKIVERHNGRIDVDSVPGQGSRFYIALPKTA